MSHSALLSIILKLVILHQKLSIAVVNRLIRHYCRRAMSESCERLCQFILNLIRCRTDVV